VIKFNILSYIPLKKLGIRIAHLSVIKTDEKPVVDIIKLEKLKASLIKLGAKQKCPFL
jgi:hypothetical protein